MTHVKNVEAYSRLVGFCAGYGGKYNPGQQNLQLDVLAAHIQSAQAVMERVKITKSLFDKAVNSRKAEFEPLGQLAASVLLTLQVAGAGQETMEDARLFVRNIAGYPLRDREPVPAAQAEGVKAKRIRSSLQLAYVSKADWLGKLVQAIEVEPLYTTREEKFTISSLFAKVQQLKRLNEEVDAAYVVWSNARIERNKILYGNVDSLFNTYVTVKKFVRSIFGVHSEEYTQLKPLTFSNHGK